MDFAALTIFRVVAREQSVTRAAELLGRVPSNVTTRIQQLETQVGVPLFHRDRKRMELTPQGAVYLDYVERILHLAEEAQQVVNPAGPWGVLRIGSMEATAATRLSQPLAAFNARWSEVVIDLSTGPTRQLVDELLMHRIDCALIAVPVDDGGLLADGLETIPLFREELVLVLPPGHPSVEAPTDIRPRGFAAFASGCAYRALAEKWLTRAARFQVHEVRSYHAMLACTAAGACFSIMPRAVLDLSPEAQCFTIKPIVIVDTHLATRRAFETPAFAAFSTVLKNYSNIS